MCAYNGLNGEFCSQNKELLTHILREQWNYDSCVVTDWGAVKDRVKGLQAGQNLEMPGSNGAQDQKILKAVQTGSLSEEELDASIKEVLKLVWRTVCQKEEASKEVKIQEETKAAADLERIHKEAVLFAEESAVLFVGLPDFYETEGEDRQHMRMPENQIRLIEEVSQVQPNTVVVLHSGSPVELPWENRVKAILNLYLAGEGAGKAAEALLLWREKSVRETGGNVAAPSGG